MGRIALSLTKLFEESNTNPMDLTRYGLAQATAYRLARGEGDGIQFDTLAMICDFFSEKLGRDITPNDILTYQRD